MPTAPYTAFSIDAGDSNNVHDLGGSQLYDSNNGTFTGSYTSANDVVELRARDNAATVGYTWRAALMPPTGSTWVAGTRYPTQNDPDATHASLHVQPGSAVCSGPGSVLIREVVRDGAQKITAFAATYAVDCFAEQPQQRVTGELRWNSSVGYTAATTEKWAKYFGKMYAGMDGPPQAITLTAKGTEPTTFGAVTFGDPTLFTVTGNTCSGATLAYGETCAVTLTPHPTQRGYQYTQLFVADNTAGGRKVVQVSLVGLDPREVAPTYLGSFGPVEAGHADVVQTVTVQSYGIQPTRMGKASIDGVAPGWFTITADTCSGTTLPVGGACTIQVTAHGLEAPYQDRTLFIPNDSLTPRYEVRLGADIGARGSYYPLTPNRILDTREGNGAPRRTVGGGETVHLQVNGRGGVPAAGVSAVVLNVTVTEPTAAGFITVYPSGLPRPVASSLNHVPGWTGANSVTVGVGANGQVDLYSHAGSTHVVVDVVGYYAKGYAGPDGGPAVGAQYEPIVPQRLLDTRSAWGDPLPAGHYAKVPVDFGANVNPHIRALAVNVTAVDPRGSGFLTTWDGQGPRPNASTLNYTAGRNVPNMAIVPTANCTDCGVGTGLPSIGVHTTTDTHLVVDVVGFYVDNGVTSGLRFQPVRPTRITDTRPDYTGPGLHGSIGPDSSVPVAADGAVFPGAVAVGLNVTAVAPTSNTFLTVWPSTYPEVDRPGVSNLNPTAGQVVANAVVTGVGFKIGYGGDLMFNVYNLAGRTDLVVDAVGAYYSSTTGYRQTYLLLSYPPSTRHG
ncbi:choice-of-anchor D domain-containing protein [Longispora fulva]|uniref:Uncharacterized protein n=1 Tax=Longispora fulva TaxID=619741 RepID=A0A8J7GVD3_9ACTN|nr:choice-of-anchor D domain-containing protein [Longispora fulva]MBG6138973.1 hypothetical protein [Longispora fulva]